MLTTEFLGRRVENPLMNAAGVMCSNEEQLQTLQSSTSGAFITKSCTVAFREGNPEPRYLDLPLGSINSMGLPNLGFEFYKTFAEAHNAKKPLFFSTSGLSLEDNVTMAAALAPLAQAGKVMLELNLSCPNVPGKPQIAYDFAEMEAYLGAVSAAHNNVFGVKMPPYFDIAHFDMAASILNKFPLVKFVTCINSVGNGLVIDVETEQVVIKPKNGFGGIGGQYILPTALANVNAFFTRCPDKYIIGCGGVTSGKEVFMHILAGATLVQVGTQLHSEGVSLFERLSAELESLMTSKGYRSVAEFHGKLKVIE